MKKIYDVVIIGSGPAGMSSAIYSSRNGLSTLIIEKSAPGGKLINTSVVENYAGFKTIKGYEIAKKMLDQVLEFGSEIIYNEVISIEDIEKKEKIIVLSDGSKIITKTIIIASGMKPRRLEVDNYDKFFGRGISICLVCDASFYKNKDIAIIGGGNSAVEESIFASNIVNKINIINIAEDLTSFSELKKELRKLKNIVEYNSHGLEKINGDKQIESITIRNLKTNELKDIKVSGIFTYIGWLPENNFILKNKSLLNKNGFFEINPYTGETKIEGVYAAGDIIQKSYKQITGAVSDGTNASLSAKKYLDLKYEK